MIILDTNVLSEFFRPRPNEQVVEAIDRWPHSEVFLTAVTVAEVRVDIALLPSGRRKVELFEATERVLSQRFDGRIVPFDLGATAFFADLVADRTRSGRPISVADGQIAAICRQRGATLATRNVRDFEGMGLDLVDPWAG